MAHCGYEPTAAMDAVKNPLKLLKLKNIFSLKTEGSMVKDLDLSKARPAIDIHEELVEVELAKIENEKKAKKEAAKVSA